MINLILSSPVCNVVFFVKQYSTIEFARYSVSRTTCAGLDTDRVTGFSY
jgi:hypothetical protein